jgi:flagellar protein FliS
VTPNEVTKAYQSTQIETATPGQLIVLMYDGAIRFLSDAARGLARGDYFGLSNGVKRAQLIISELMSALDMDSGGEIAANLVRIYGFLFDSLTEASLDHDQAKIEMVLEHLRTLRSAWEQVERRGRGLAGEEAKAG